MALWGHLSPTDARPLFLIRELESLLIPTQVDASGVIFFVSYFADLISDTAEPNAQRSCAPGRGPGNGFGTRRSAHPRGAKSGGGKNPGRGKLGQRIWNSETQSPTIMQKRTLKR